MKQRPDKSSGSQGSKSSSLGLSDSEMRKFQIAGWSTATLLGLFVLAMILAEYAPSAMQSIGLGFLVNEESGVYADCSKERNRNNPFCSKRQTPRDRDWRKLGDKGGGSGAFNLHE